jgi:hypothetical protein
MPLCASLSDLHGLWMRETAGVRQMSAKESLINPHFL